MGAGIALTAAKAAAKAAEKALALLKKRAGKGGEKTFKEGGDQAGFGNTSQTHSTNSSRTSLDDTRGFGGDVRDIQDKLAGPGSHLSHSTLKDDLAKLKAKVAKAKAAEAKAAKAKAKKDNPNALETPGYLKTTDDTTEFDDEIAEAIETMKAAFKREAAKKNK